VERAGKRHLRVALSSTCNYANLIHLSRCPVGPCSHTGVADGAPDGGGFYESIAWNARVRADSTNRLRV
jgi:hypothetical protein